MFELGDIVRYTDDYKRIVNPSYYGDFDDTFTVKKLDNPHNYKYPVGELINNKTKEKKYVSVYWLKKGKNKKAEVEMEMEQTKHKEIGGANEIPNYAVF